MFCFQCEQTASCKACAVIPLPLSSWKDCHKNRFDKRTDCTLHHSDSAFLLSGAIPKLPT